MYFLVGWVVDLKGKLCIGLVSVDFAHDETTPCLAARPQETWTAL